MTIENNSSCLLLTATINPGTFVPSLKRLDSALRETDYLEAVQSWTQYNIPIVFCENSNTRSQLILQALRDSGVKFEYLCFQSTKSNLGKGNGEFEIFEYAFENSEIIKECMTVVKVTGRYGVKNFTPLFDHFITEQSFLYLDLKHNLSWADSRFFCFQKEFWTRYLKNNGVFIDENNNVHFETVLAKSALLAVADGKKRDSPKSIPWISGVYGTDNKPYKNNYATYVIKNIIYQLKLQLVNRLPF